MKKIIKFIFSRITIAAILIALQLILIIFIINRAYDMFKWFQLAMFLLEILIILDISKRDIPADLKIPWLAVVILLPIVGVIIYVIFSKNRARKKHVKYFKNILSSSQEIIQDYKIDYNHFDKYEDCINYITNTSGCIGFENTSTEYFDSGESFYKTYLEDLKSATSFIFMEYFIISKGLMFETVLDILKEKVKNGVEVRIMYDDIGSMGKLPSNFSKKMKEYGIICVKFNPFTPIISAIHNNRDHRKITVIDGKIGYVGGINFADEYINVVKRFGYWKDSTVKICGEATLQLTVMFLQNFNLQNKTVEDFTKYTNIKFEKINTSGYVVPFCDGPTPIYVDLIGENTYINLINHATTSIKIATPYLLLDTQLKNALSTASKRGVRVQIFTPHIPDKKYVFALTRSNYFDLLKNGIEIFEFQPGFLHNKNLIVDDEIAIVGTINLDYRSMIHHYECGIVLYKTSSINKIIEDFDNIIKYSIHIDPNKFKLRWDEKLISSLLNIFQPLL